ncbi:MAG: BatD family protein, partial [Acidobacteriota bacterium]|nr:BatD family protein [Acidobacteriota bacterium]
PTPANFSGLVGSFDLDTAISKTELAVGESATLEVKISGDGNPQLIAEPKLAELSSFKTYADKPSSAVNRSGSKLRGSKTFKTALVPLVSGELTVPGMELVYFDPESGSYRTDRTDDIVLQVTPSEGEEELRLTEALAPTTGKVAVRILADDILPLHRGLDALDVPWTRRAAWWLPVGLALPLLAYLTMVVLRRRREAYERDSGLRRRRGALRSAQRCLKEVGEASDAAPQASRCLRRYIGDKLGAEGTALTPAECGDLLRAAEVDDETVTETTRVLERLEAAQYGAGAVAPGQLQAELESLLQRLEKQIKG